MDYEKAINNLHNILTHEDKFAEINKSIFDAIDTDNSGTLEREEVESFVKSLLVGITNDEDEEYDQNERHRIVFGVLDENESGEITLDELGKFLRELFKEQIKELQDASERMKRKAASSLNDGWNNRGGGQGGPPGYNPALNDQ